MELSYTLSEDEMRKAVIEYIKKHYEEHIVFDGRILIDNDEYKFISYIVKTPLDSTP